MYNIISKLKSVRLCLEAHPYNEPHSEFADRISDLSAIIEDLENNNLIIQTKEIFRDSEEMILESKMNFE